MCGLIEANLDLCQIPEHETHVVQAEAADFLRLSVRKSSTSKSEPWDIVFFDPPYATEYLPILEKFGKHASNLFFANGLLIVEHHHKNELADRAASLVRKRILKQGDSALSFYEVT